ncbi:PREDICTED: myosin regulatory light chain 10 isoform X1 [Dipodomys ordii]|uniref:Myosin regulatory light chain 10 isoform X1 n=1 Tax=Dipodomys ordii TaxID=10020 RepID=A0A1S3GET0_DIPOR|nr:PREDICTED: myosin regulatory light chain 10 isoform X1 [Dipodomys ordii]
MFDQSQIQEFKEGMDLAVHLCSESPLGWAVGVRGPRAGVTPPLSHQAFTIMDQNRDGFIDKEDLRDTFAALGRINVKNEELEVMVKEAPGPINFTVFLTMFGEKLKGTDPEETILHAFKVFDTEGKGFVKADFIKEKLMTQADRFSEEEAKQMFAAFPPDAYGNLDYRNLCYVITHGEEKD